MAAQDQATAQRAPIGVSFAARLDFERICHSYGSGRATLDDVSLSAMPGEVLCLLGPSGSGKTTLLRIAAGIEPQTHGRLVMNGSEIAGPSVFLPPEQRSIGLVFQDFALFPHMTILENVRFGLTALSHAQANEEAWLALARVGLLAYASAYPHVLSGGEQQRVALARALAPRPAVLLMDEPFSGLDSRLKDNVRADTLNALRQSRATAVIVTHDAEEAMRMADRIALLKDGKLVQTGAAEDIFRKPASLFAAGFFSELNVFDSVVRAGMAETPLGKFAALGHADGAKVTVAIRLSALGAAKLAGNVPARILTRRFLGDAELFELAVPGLDRPVRARMPCGAMAGVTGDFGLAVNESGVLVFERQTPDA